MTRPAVFTARFRIDLRDHLRWIVDTAGPSTSLALLAALRVAAERLGQRPMIGRAQPDWLPAPFRLWSIPRWHVLLVYDPSTQPPRVLRLFEHGPRPAGTPRRARLLTSLDTSRPFTLHLGVTLH